MPDDRVTPYHSIITALMKAGHVEGSHHTGSGWSDEGCLEYEPPVAGFVVDSRHVHDFGLPQKFWFVDHAGKGAKLALPKYEAALKAAGIPCHIGLKAAHGKKNVVVVEIACDLRGLPLPYPEES
jgi:hypothetical protein